MAKLENFLAFMAVLHTYETLRGKTKFQILAKDVQDRLFDGLPNGLAQIAKTHSLCQAIPESEIARVKQESIQLQEEGKVMIDPTMFENEKLGK